MAQNFANDSINEIDDLTELFQERIYPQKHLLIKSNKTKDAVLHLGYYYNHSRLTKSTTVY